MKLNVKVLPRPVLTKVRFARRCPPPADFIVVNPKASKANKIRQLRNFANITEKVLGFENATTLKTWNGLGMILKTEGVGTSNLQML